MVFLEKIMRYMNALLVLIYKYLKNERKEASKMKKNQCLRGIFSAALAISLFGTSLPVYAEEGGKEITYFYNTSTEAATEVVQEAIKRYEEKTGNTVKITMMEGESYKTKIKTCVASNSLPDVFNYWTGEQFSTLVSSGNVKDITEMVTKDTEYKEQFIDGAFDEVTVGEKIYGIPSSVTGQVLYYNKQLFKDAGIEKVPSTFSELEDACAKLKDAGITPIMVGSKDRWPLLGWFSYLAVRNGGTELYREVTDGESEASFANPEFIKAGEQLNKLSQEYFVNGSLAIDSAMAPAQFAAGNAAMFIGGTWDISTLSSNEEMADNISFAPFPSADDGKPEDSGTIYGGIANCIAINESSENADDAYELIKEIISVETETEMVKKTGSLSCMKVEVEKEDMPLLGYEITEFFNNEVTGFFPYTDQALQPEQAENLLNAMTEIIASEDVNVEEQLSTIK